MKMQKSEKNSYSNLKINIWKINIVKSSFLFPSCYSVMSSLKSILCLDIDQHILKCRQKQCIFCWTFQTFANYKKNREIAKLCFVKVSYFKVSSSDMFTSSDMWSGISHLVNTIFSSFSLIQNQMEAQRFDLAREMRKFCWSCCWEKGKWSNLKNMIISTCFITYQYL